MIEELIKADCIKIGYFKLKNGQTSKYYYDMKNLISHPHLLKKIGDAIYEKIGSEFDLICGIPYGGLPIATYISTKYGKPMIMLRNQEKDYGTQKRIEGTYSSTNRCVIIDDVITSGGSLQEAVDVLKD